MPTRESAPSSPAEEAAAQETPSLVRERLHGSVLHVARFSVALRLDSPLLRSLRHIVFRMASILPETEPSQALLEKISTAPYIIGKFGDPGNLLQFTT